MKPFLLLLAYLFFTAPVVSAKRKNSEKSILEVIQIKTQEQVPLKLKVSGKIQEIFPPYSLKKTIPSKGCRAFHFSFIDNDTKTVSVKVQECPSLVESQSPRTSLDFKSSNYSVEQLQSENGDRLAGARNKCQRVGDYMEAPFLKGKEIALPFQRQFKGITTCKALVHCKKHPSIDNGTYSVYCIKKKDLCPSTNDCITDVSIEKLNDSFSRLTSNQETPRQVPKTSTSKSAVKE